MKILYLTHTCPYPPNRGDRIRCYHILAHLAQRHALTLVYPAFTDEHLEHQDALQQYCETVFPVKYNRLFCYSSCFSSLFGRYPLSVAFFYSRKLQKLLRTLSPDFILADCSTMAPYVIDLPCPKILDFVDIDSQKWYLFSAMTCFPYSLVYHLESKRLSRFEQFLAARFDYCLVTSRYEKSLLNNCPNIAVLPNGVDQQYFSAHNAPAKGNIIFTGVMNYFPNSDAVLHFHRGIFPLIKREVPSAQFIIAGMHPTAQIRALADHDTTVTGFVPDIREYLSRASVCVVPLRLAMGVQNKILEAMAMGVPVVATAVANRGINATHGREILVADDPASFAEATVTLLKDQQLRESITENAKKFIEQNFRWEKNLRQLDELISQVMGHAAAHRDMSSH
jgi:sugar transferase (PEP-CTERM/EpsH1 system associated)